jgi:hypothetical protein
MARGGVPVLSFACSYLFYFFIFEAENEDISTNFFLESSEIAIIFKKFRNDVSKSLEK